MTDFTIVIAHRGNPMGLWATIQSCEIDLERTDYKYNYCIACNGDRTFDVEISRTLHYLDKLGKLKQSLWHPEPWAPPTARQFATTFADGKYLFFFDNHCLVSPQYFTRALLDFKTYPVDVLHSSFRYYSGEGTHYHYKLSLEKDFWAKAVLHPTDAAKPYPIAVSGHGGFVVKRDVWDEIGGYWTGFQGYGGEETYFDLKAWMMGKQVWVDPRLVHYHYAGRRTYSRHYTDDYYRNMMMAANIIGGERWAYKVYGNFEKSVKLQSQQSMYDLLQEALSRSAEHAVELASKRTKSLDELLPWFEHNNISF